MGTTALVTPPRPLLLVNAAATAPRTYQRLLVNIQGDYRRDTLEGRPHLVVPCVMLKEGVISGSKGPVLYTAVENAASVPDWDHMPIVVDHPKEGDTFVSARSKQWIDSRKVGIILNTKHDEKLSTECWFDEARTQQVDKRVYDAILNRKPMETSTGLGAFVDETPGEFAGVAYSYVARNYKPDHLAVLPDSVGALSVAAGGGLFANAAKVQPESTQTVLSRSAVHALGTIGGGLTANELSFSRITSALCDLLSARFGVPGKYWDGWVSETYSDYCIFYDGRSNLFSIGYTTSGDEVSLSGDAVPVVREVVYKTTDGDTLVSNAAGSLTRVPKDSVMDKKALINSLIANGTFAEADRAKLEATDEAVLKKFSAPPPAPAAPPPAPAAATVANAAPAVPSGPLSMEQLKSILPPEFWAVHNQGQQALNATRERYTTKIKANPNNKFPDAMLANMSIEQLAATAELATPAVPDPSTQFLNGWTPDFAGAMAPFPDAGVIGNAATAANAPPEAASGGLTLPSLDFSKPAA